MMTIKKMSRVKAHTIYKNSNSKRVPGVTTVVGLRAKPFLVKWANDLGLEGIDVGSYVDMAATIGTLTHQMVNAHITQKELDTSEYSQKEISMAENAMLSFLEWIKNKNITVILAETSMVSEAHQFGGTFDLYCEMDGRRVLVDFKSSNAIYPENAYQLAAYKLLLEENGNKVDSAMIVRIGRDETEGFETKEFFDLSLQTDIFLDLLDVYNKEKVIRKGTV